MQGKKPLCYSWLPISLDSEFRFLHYKPKLSIRMNFQRNFKPFTRVLFVLLLSAMLVMSMIRIVFLFNISDENPLHQWGYELFDALFMGIRFDIKVIAIGYAPLLLIALFASVLVNGERLWQRVVPSYTSLISFLLVALSIVNYYYYVTYGNYIDLFIFGLKDDDTQAVFVNMWKDYPIIRAFFISIGIAFISAYSIRNYMSLLQKRTWLVGHWSVETLGVAVLIVIYFLLARGSVGSLPLKRYHANVSQHQTLNVITPNAFMALDWAIGDYKKQTHIEPIEVNKLQAQLQGVLGQANAEHRTPHNEYLSQHPPHVVMALMEGMGSNVLVEDDMPHNDLLGELRSHLEQDFFFSRFLASTSATIDSIVMMLMHSDVPTISHSNAQKVPLASSAVRPYKRAGYEVVFVYGGNSMWRNLANYLPLQGFDRVYGENSIKSAFPDSEQYADTWGMPDEYTFRFARKVLDEATQPTLIYIMTVTNHSPYRAPDYYHPKPTQVSERLASLLGPMANQGNNLLQAYQYANDSLGKFISGVKQSPLRDNTLIAASGDHRVRYLAQRHTEEIALAYAVPFYIYIPDVIRDHVEYVYDSKRIGSHRDIFPTLYHFSLSDESYISLGGENLLSPLRVQNVGFNTAAAITEHGAFLLAQPEQLYPWDSGLFTKSQPVVNTSSQWALDYKKLVNYYLRYQVSMKDESSLCVADITQLH